MTIFHFSNKNRTLSDEDFEIIYKTYYSRLYYYTFQFITDEENSKDIVNDVFEKIWIQRHELKLETLSSYLYTLVRNRCLDYLHIPADTRSAFPVISVQSPVSIQCCWQS